MGSELRERLIHLKSKIEEFKKILKIDEKEKKIQELQMKMSSSEFWKNSETSRKIINELKSLKREVEEIRSLEARLREVKDIMELEDASYEDDITKELDNLDKDMEKFQLRTLLQDRFDDANAIVEINAGAGGTEACDWVSMLFRMYFRWAQDKGFDVRILNEVQGEEAGIKNITFFVEGRYAYGFLKAERGVHRLVRISPFDANKRRHTSFASVDVLPEIEEEEIEIDPRDLKIETFRASGHGGQHVNRTDSAVRITHIPTGIVVSCQNERSQYQNKQTALRILRAKLYELKEEEKRKEIQRISGDKQKIEWGSQIRSYILHPYLLVKDHRTQLEVHNAYEVLDGKLDDFIYSYLVKEVKTDKDAS